MDFNMEDLHERKWKPCKGGMSDGIMGPWNHCS
jgi:hypothetical protein